MNKIQQWANNFEHIEYNTTHNTISGSSVADLVANPLRWYNNLQTKKHSNMTQAMKAGVIYEQQIVKTLVGEKEYNLIMHENENGENLPYIKQSLGLIDLIATFDAVNPKDNIIYEIKTTTQPHNKYLQDARYQLALYMRLYDNEDATLIFATYNPSENKPLTRENITTTILRMDDVMPWIKDIGNAIIFLQTRIWDFQSDTIKDFPKAKVLEFKEPIDSQELLQNYEAIKDNIKVLNKGISDAKKTLANLEAQIKFKAATDKTFEYTLVWNTKAKRSIETKIQGYEFELEVEKR